MLVSDEIVITPGMWTLGIPDDICGKKLAL